MASKQNILIIEDEKDLADIISYNLQQAGFETKIVLSGKKGYEEVIKRSPDLVILDIMLPEMNGIDICKKIRQQANGEDILILILSAKADEIDRVLGFELGADDYLAKPFSPKELILRVKALLRRVENKQEDHSVNENNIQYHDMIELDLTKHRVWVEKQEIHLTLTQFRLLEYFLTSRGRILTRESILNKVWGHCVNVTERSIDSHVMRLRKKIEKKVAIIETVIGVGYRLKEI